MISNHFNASYSALQSISLTPYWESGGWACQYTLFHFLTNIFKFLWNDSVFLFISFQKRIRPKSEIEMLITKKTVIVQQLLELVLVIFRWPKSILSLLSKKVKNKTWAKLPIITVTKKTTKLMLVPSQKTSTSFDNCYVNNWYSKD